MAYKTVEWKTGHEKGKKPPATSIDDKRWWLLKGRAVADSVSGVINTLRQYHQARLERLILQARAYGNIGLVGPVGSGYLGSQGTSPSTQRTQRLTFNVIQSATDTVTSKIASKNKPKPMFLTSGGDYRQRNKAKQLNKFIDGIFWENKMTELGPELFRDACVWGDGIVHVFEQDGRVIYERVLPSEILVDEYESVYRRPRSLHRLKLVDRQQLIGMYPEHEQFIKDAQGATLQSASASSSIADLVEVRESWHLPSGSKAEDGRAVITIEGCTLSAPDEEKWQHNFFPFAKMPWCPRLSGFWSQGLAEILDGTQNEINRLCYTVSRSYHLAGSFKILLAYGSKVDAPKLDNQVGSIIYYQGNTPPQYITPPILPPEIYQQFNTLIQRAYMLAHLSELSVASRKPAGLDSGKALREFNDIESDGFRTIGHTYEQFHLEVARLSIACVQDMAKREGTRKYSVSMPDKRTMALVDWKDINLDADEYVMQCFPISSLPNDPAGRLQTIQEYIQAGFLDQREGRRLLAFPDLDQEESLQTAPEEYLLKGLDGIVYESEPFVLEEYDDLVLAHKLALGYYAMGKGEWKLEEEKLQLIRNVIDRAIELIQKAAPPAPPAMPPGTPTGVPAPAPQSELLPNAPEMAA